MNYRSWINFHAMCLCDTGVHKACLTRWRVFREYNRTLHDAQDTLDRNEGSHPNHFYFESLYFRGVHKVSLH